MAACVLTLIATPLAVAQLEGAVALAAETLRGLGAAVGRSRSLAPSAVDIPFEDLNADQADAAARQALSAAMGAPAIDVVAQPTAERRKRLLLADMESTIIANEMLDELADFVGLREQIAAITQRAMNDEIDFEAALRERVAMLRGLDQRVLIEAGARIAIMPGAPTLVTTMRAHGARTILVSGGFRHYTLAVRQSLGFDEDVANELVIEGGKLAGRVVEPIRGRDSKLTVLKGAAAAAGLPLAATLAVGDGANDLAMIDAAGLGIAFHAKPAVAARARHRIDHGDLTALLYAQGYRAEEIITLDRA